MDEDEYLQYLIDNGEYDYRKAFLLGEKPAYNFKDNSYHWGSKKNGEWLKSPNNPTTWKEIFFEQTGADPDGFGIESIQQADSVMAELGLGKIQDKIPTEWNPLPEFEPPKEKFFRSWLKSTKWFKQLYKDETNGTR